MISRSILREDEDKKQTKKHDLHECQIRIAVEKDFGVGYMLTGIRILKGVAVCTQESPSIHTKSGDSVINISVKWVPDQGNNQGGWIVLLARLIKSLPGIQLVRVISFDDGPVTRSDGSPLVI